MSNWSIRTHGVTTCYRVGLLLGEGMCPSLLKQLRGPFVSAKIAFGEHVRMEAIVNLQVASASRGYLLPICLCEIVQAKMVFRRLRENEKFVLYIRVVTLVCKPRRFTDLLRGLYNVRESGRKAQKRVFAVISAEIEMSTVISATASRPKPACKFSRKVFVKPILTGSPYLLEFQCKRLKIQTTFGLVPMTRRIKEVSVANIQ